jgi:DNA-binding MarR family transcriptional regulator
MPDFARTARKIARECPTIRARQASRVLTRVYDDVLRPLGLQMSQFSVLVQIAAFGEAGATITALAAELVMDRTTLTRNLRPLERAGMLRVAQAPGDARARVVLLTHRGEKIIDTAYPYWEAAFRRVRVVLGARQLQALRTELTALIEVAPGFDEPAPSGRSVKSAARR